MSENPNPSLWRAGPLAINLARVVAAMQLPVDGFPRYAVLFDCPAYRRVRTVPNETEIDNNFFPLPQSVTGPQWESFLDALEIFHSKR